MTTIRHTDRGRPGFTLIELILVLALLAVISSYVAPSLSKFVRGRSLDSEARRLLAVTRAAGGRAVSLGVPVRVWLDTAGRGYGMESELLATNMDTQVVSFQLEDHLSLEVLNTVAVATVPGQSRATGASSSRNQTSLNTPATPGRFPALRFLPDGSVDDSSPQGVRLTDSEGFSRLLVQSRSRMGYEIQ